MDKDTKEAESGIGFGRLLALIGLFATVIFGVVQCKQASDSNALAEKIAAEEADDRAAAAQKREEAQNRIEEEREAQEALSRAISSCKSTARGQRTERPNLLYDLVRTGERGINNHPESDRICSEDAEYGAARDGGPYPTVWIKDDGIENSKVVCTCNPTT